MSEVHIRTLLKGEKSNQLSLAETEKVPNHLALADLLSYIELNAQGFAKTSLKSVTDYLKKAPYGFTEDDIQWLVAKLFKDGYEGKSIEFTMNNEEVSLLGTSPEEIYRYLSRKEFLEKLMISPGIDIPEKHKKAVRDVMKDLFHVTPSGDDAATVRKSFGDYAEWLKAELETREQAYKYESSYLGISVIKEGKALLVNAMSIKNTGEFFETIYKQQDDFLDFAEDYEPVRAFFEGEQIKIWQKALGFMKIYNDSKTFIVNTQLESIVGQIQDILKMTAPYSSIRTLPQLLEQYIDVYTAVFTEMEAPVQHVIEEARQRVLTELEGKSCKEQMIGTVLTRFEALKEKAAACNNVAVLQNITVEADALKIRLLNEVTAAEAKAQAVFRQEAGLAGGASMAKENPAAINSAADSAGQMQKRIKTISIKSVNTEKTWRIETEADIDQYIEALWAKLKQQLEEDTVLHIEF